MSTEKPLRLWPGVTIAVLELLLIAIAPFFGSDGVMYGLLGGVVAALLTLLWWLFLSRAPWIERIGAIALMVVAIFAAKAVAHESVAGAGQGMMMYFLPAPLLALALVAWAAASSRLQGAGRYASLAAAIVIACAPFTLIRTAGVRGGGSFFEPHWRWTPTPEQILLSTVKDEPKPLPPAPVAIETPKEEPKVVAPAPTKPVVVATPIAPGEPEWLGFRGPNRDSIIHGVTINTNWAASPPVQIWRRPIGPGWSSFAVHGDFLFTQEQRGDEELVSCYRVSTGEPVWRHRDPIRFYESNGGAGPRSTPTLSHGRVYTSGATGMLNALDERTGAVLWSHQVAVETKTPTPMWGFSASPLAIDDLVIVAASGALAAYDAATGKQRWANPSKGGSYSSPQRATIDGVEQVLLLAGPAVMSVSPADGKLLWDHKWDGGAIVQPAITPDGGVLINAMSMTGGVGTRRLAVAKKENGWSVEERWTSNGLKPYFNDFVIHKGYAYGFDNSILSCINLEDGARMWKGGRYGNGQMLLLADQDLLLVISEEGELALVSATTDKFTELARFPALDGKTWNHPVIVGDHLLVRNGQEMAAFRLSLGPQTSERVDAGSPPRR